MTPRPLIALLCLACLAGRVHAGVVEESFSTPIHLPGATTGEGVTVSVLVVRPSDTRRHPMALLLHGRGVDAAENQRLGRADFPANARYLAERGYAVLIPTRIGYGITGGPDIEATGTCEHKSAIPALRTASEEMRRVLDSAARHRWADATRILVMGDSFGGLIALALGAEPPPGLKGIVNVAGGDGGDSLRHVDSPCDPASTADAFATLGRDAKVPALFLYSTNDRFWGVEWPRRWYETWRQAGGRGAFVSLPPDKNNGHFIFNRNAPAWHGPVEQFVQSLGLP